MKTIFAAGGVWACVVLLASSALAQTSAQTPAASANALPLVYDPARDAAADLKLAEAEAARTHRKILVDIGGRWCIWCKYLDLFFSDHKDVVALRDQEYVFFKVNFSKENPNKEFLAPYGKIPGYPHLLLLDENGHLLCSQPTNVLEDGHSYDKKQMEKLLKKGKCLK